MKLIYIQRDHKDRANRVHDFSCQEAKAGHRWASGNGFGDQANWDLVECETRQDLINELIKVYGQEEWDDYLSEHIKWEPCVKI